MSKKIGRNSPCWCGSGKKHKKCHLDRDDQKPQNIWNAMRDLNKAFGEKYCLCAKGHNQPCKGNIINAHTVSKSSCLKAISRDSHVYSFLLPFTKHLKIKNGKPKSIFEPELCGINKSSTFTGFCKTHDRILFSPVENKKFTGSKEQLFLLSYRALAREVFGKVAQANMEQTYRNGDKGSTIFGQVEYQKDIDALISGVTLANRDLKYQKDKFDEILLNCDFEQVEGIVIKCNMVPNIMCCGSIFPHYDFEGKVLQDFLNYNLRLQSIYLNIIQADGVGYIVFSWLKNDSVICKKFIESLLKFEVERITDAVIRLLFEHFENKFANPNWWESLSKQKQCFLNKKFADSINFSLDIDTLSLVEDFITYDNWKVESIQYV